MNYLSRQLLTGSLAFILSCASSVAPKEPIQLDLIPNRVSARDLICPYEWFGLERQGRYFAFACSSTTTQDICAMEERDYSDALRRHREKCR
ncbi:MAG TPA: hypothetical protein VJI98_04250 [Candidatus Nanoarchaeia archaeon]|nr:hypothetical protein [Candidatus Nanoarchaeia archaeon]